MTDLSLASLREALPSPKGEGLDLPAPQWGSGLEASYHAVALPAFASAYFFHAAPLAAFASPYLFYAVPLPYREGVRG